MLEFYELAKAIDVFFVFGIVYILCIAMISSGVATVIKWIADLGKTIWKKCKATNNKTEE